MDTKRFFLYAIVIAAMILAGCGGNGGTTKAPPPPPGPTDAQKLTAAKAAAMAAYEAAKAAKDAAMTAKDAAMTTVTALEGKMSSDVPNHTRALDAKRRADEAYQAAMAAYEAAKAANTSAQAATTLADGEQYRDVAQAEQAKAEAAQAQAEAENRDVTKYAGMVTAAYNEMQALMQAQTAAMTAATEARAAATAAATAAAAVERLLGAEHPETIAAKAAAMAAETAATAAETAKAAAAAATTSAEAMAKQTEAATAKATAMAEQAKAEESLRLARIRGQDPDVQAQVQIGLAQDAARVAKDEARTAADKAREYANKADEAADAAEAAAADAKRKRTNSAEAEKQAMAARAAATAAEAAATAAEAAATAAEAESEKARAEGVSVEDALAARDMARTKRAEAETQRDTAMAKYDSDDEDAMGAKQLAALAKTAGGEYGLELFKVASGQGLADAAKKTRVELVEDLIRMAGDEERDTHVTVGEAKALTPNANGTGTADNSVDGLWQYNTNDNDQIGNNAYGARIEHPIGKDRVYRFGKYTAEHLRTPDPAVTTAQATQRDLPALGGFTGVELTQGTRAVHIYTDYDPSKRKAAIKAGNISGVLASSGTVSGTFDLSTAGTITALAGSRFTAGGVTYSGTGLEFACTAPADCSYTSTGAAATATITSLGSGWKVTGSAAAVPEAGDPDYMTFGYWLDLGGSTANNQDERLGAFASGNAFSSTIADGVITALTGNATYRGHAAGLHGMTGAKEAVQPFDAKAELTAKFGTATELGTVEGRIYDINSGGERLTGELSEVILSKGDVNSATSRSFTYYDTRMGTPTVDPTDSSAEYPMNGWWHGRFSEAMVDTTDAAKKYPTAVIGTFGVSGTLDMGTADNTKDDVTHSLIGAFGTHLEQ